MNDMESANDAAVDEDEQVMIAAVLKYVCGNSELLLEVEIFICAVTSGLS